MGEVAQHLMLSMQTDSMQRCAEEDESEDMAPNHHALVGRCLDLDGNHPESGRVLRRSLLPGRDGEWFVPWSGLLFQYVVQAPRADIQGGVILLRGQPGRCIWRDLGICMSAVNGSMSRI